MSKQKLKFIAKNISNAEEDKDIVEIAKKRGISMPSSHLGFFKTVFCEIEHANLNGIRLSKASVENALEGLIGSQTNFSHLQAGFIMGYVLDAWINEHDQVEVIYSFFKAIYPDEYLESLELLKEGELGVSFELLADRESQEHLADGTIRLHKIDFIGMGHLMSASPACPIAKPYEFASKVKKNLSHAENKTLICASEIEKQCDEVLANNHLNNKKVKKIKTNKQKKAIDDGEDIPFPENLFIVTSQENSHFHIAHIDFDGNGKTISTMGTNGDAHIHKVMNFQIQADGDHTHRIMDEIIAKIKEYAQESNKIEQKENKTLTEKEIKQVEKIRAELGDIVKDVQDKDLLDEAKVEEFRKAVKETQKDDKKPEDNKGEKSDLEKAQEEIKVLKEENETLVKTLEAKDSEIESVRENAEKIATLKIQLKDNPHVADFSDEDYLDEDKVERAKDKKELDDVKAENEELKKSKQKAKNEKDEHKASKEKEQDMHVGSQTEDEDVSVRSAVNNIFTDKEK